MRALISVSDKRGVSEFAEGLVELGWEVLSTGGTASRLKEAGLPVTDVSAVTGFPEILDGRVKTLHPAVHGGILARRELDWHLREIGGLGIRPIDLVAVNLYPFRSVAEKAGVSWEEIIENIDIGGPALLRAAAKNYRDVIVVVDPSRYPQILAALRGKGLGEEERFHLALEVFQHTAFYDAVIASYLTKWRSGERVKSDQSGAASFRSPASWSEGTGISREIDLFSDQLTIALEKVQELRYGENPHQRAALYWWPGRQSSFSSLFRQHQGKELSFNNLNDAEAALRLVWEFEGPAAVAVKHANPCGVGLAGELLTAYQKAYQADPVSIFGGILALNRRVEGSLAREINKIFVEIVLAPGFSPEALEVFRKKKDLRLLEIQIAGESLHARPDPLPLDLRRITGGFLLQEQDLAGENPGSWQRVAGPEQPEEVLADLLFAWKVVKHARSNAIVVAQAGQTLGIGSGQTNRIDAARQALERARSIKKGMLDQAVLASDAFFPFPDVVEAAGQAGIRALVQPGGSVRDEESIALAERLGISMYFTGRRHFRH